MKGTSASSQNSGKSEPTSSVSSNSSATPSSSSAAPSSSARPSSSSAAPSSSSSSTRPSSSSSQPASSSSSEPSSSAAPSSSSSQPASSSSAPASSSSAPASSSSAPASSSSQPSSSSEQPAVASTFRVVGSFNDWDYSKGVTFVDATEAEEVQKGTYVNRYKAQFTITPQKMFKVRNEADIWIGGDKMVANEYFENIVEDNNNILSYYKGDVTLYLSVLANDDYQINIDFVKEASKMVDVTFSIVKEAPEGKSVYLVGSFCNWSAADESAVRFNKGEGNNWSATFKMITNEYIEFKFILADTENPTEQTWEAGNNRVIIILASFTSSFTWQAE